MGQSLSATGLKVSEVITIFDPTPEDQAGFVQLYSEEEAREKGHVSLMVAIKRIMRVGRSSDEWRKHPWLMK